jgi:hypothetical protein
VKTCPKCGGSGRGDRACGLCSGLGKHSCTCGDASHVCGVCLGSGLLACVVCEGRGAIRGKHKGSHLVGKNLTQTRDGGYIARHTRATTPREAYLLGETHLTDEEFEMRYGSQKLDLEKLGVKELKYRDTLASILRSCEWNVTFAAKKAGMSRSSLYRRIHVLSIKIPTNVRRGTTIFSHKIAGVVDAPPVGTRKVRLPVGALVPVRGL